jgi:LPS-assembly lipoprotein
MRQAFGALALALLAGCGFTPMYGTHSASHAPAVTQEFAAIDIPPMPDKIGVEFRNLLIDSLHPSGASPDYRYKLVAQVREAVVGLGLQENATTTRGQVRITVKYYLIDTQNGKTVLNETLRASTGYNVLINQFSSLLSQYDAEQQALQEVSDDLTTHLALYFDTKEEKPAGG